MADDIMINGVSVATYLTPVSLISGFIGPPPLMGSDYTIPGYVGAIPAPLGKGPRPVTFGGLVVGKPTPAGVPGGLNPRALYIQKLDQLSALVYNNAQPFTLTWMTDGASRTTTARYLDGLSDITDVTPWAGRVAITLLLLNPYWS